MWNEPSTERNSYRNDCVWSQNATLLRGINVNCFNKLRNVHMSLVLSEMWPNRTVEVANRTGPSLPHVSTSTAILCLHLLILFVCFYSNKWSAFRRYTCRSTKENDSYCPLERELTLAAFNHTHNNWNVIVCRQCLASTLVSFRFELLTTVSSSDVLVGVSLFLY